MAKKSDDQDSTQEVEKAAVTPQADTIAEQTERQFVATEALFIGRARAANPGDVVPAGHVEKYGWDKKVQPLERD